MKLPSLARAPAGVSTLHLVGHAGANEYSICHNVSVLRRATHEAVFEHWRSSAALQANSPCCDRNGVSDYH